jgi:hypothetical protein
MSEIRNQRIEEMVRRLNNRDEGTYWIFGYVREAIVQLDNTP